MKRLIFLCFLFFIKNLAAQNARQVGLIEALELAKTNSANLKKSMLDRQSLEHKIIEERSVIFPQISSGVEFDAFPVLPTQLIPGEFINQPGSYVPVRFGQPWRLSGGFDVEQLLYSESYRRAIPAREASRALFDLMTQKSADEVIFNTAAVFYQTLQTSEMLRTVNANLEKLTALQKMAQLQADNGYATPTDVKRLTVAHTNLETQKTNLLAGIEALQNTLKFMCGQPLDQAFVPAETLPSPAADSTKWLALKPDVANVVEHRLLLKTIELLRIRSRSLSAERYPTLKVYGSGLVQSQRPDPNFITGYSRWFGMVAFGVRLRAPIFDGFRRQGKQAQMDFEILKMEEDRRQIAEAKALEFSQAKSQFTAALRTLKLQEINVELAKEIRDKTALFYKEGNAPLSDLLSAQTAVSEAETNYFQQVFTYKLATLKLAKAAGRADLVE